VVDMGRRLAHRQIPPLPAFSGLSFSAQALIKLRLQTWTARIGRASARTKPQAQQEELISKLLGAAAHDSELAWPVASKPMLGAGFRMFSSILTFHLELHLRLDGGGQWPGAWLTAQIPRYPRFQGFSFSPQALMAILFSTHVWQFRH
jgi:hypothetical protein